MKNNNSLLQERLEGIKYYLLDMDGTIYLGDKLIDGADNFIRAISGGGRDYIFLTNNSSKNARIYLEKLDRLGISTSLNNIVISTYVLTYYLKKKNSEAVLYPLGTEYFEEDLNKSGFSLIHHYSPESIGYVDYVVLGFDMNLTYEKLAGACRYIRKGVPYLATHPDLTCPVEGGEFIPDCGAMIELIKAATGCLPEVIAGKPNPMMIDMIVEERGWRKDEMAIVGDRLYTDIRQGLNSEITSILVLSGETTEKDLSQSEIKPDFVVNSVDDIHRALKI